MDEKYQRLTLFEFADFSRLRSMSALVVGVGGLGAIVTEIMARVGIGRLVLMDYDTLELANMNRLIYKPSQVGKYKVDALEEYLTEVNLDVDIATYPFDITTGEGYKAFVKELKQCDVVFGCVDSFGVRLFINAKCVENGKTLIDGGASLDGIRGSVQVVIPNKTACYRCHRHALGLGRVESGAELKEREKREENLDFYLSIKEPAKDRPSGICHLTSLPTTMAVIAALQCQEGFKHLLDFGKVASFLMYNGISGEVERYDRKKDPGCPVCGTRKVKMDEKKLEEIEKAAEMFDKMT
ncbi:MAG: HesA/MoeB/ThiF family protein [Thermoplasmata archaeon]|nr:MAG: HesA/MoeB/ThiF family protein [Thermoplasmata archaeon]